MERRGGRGGEVSNGEMCGGEGREEEEECWQCWRVRENCNPVDSLISQKLY